MQDFLSKPLSPTRAHSFRDCELLFRYRSIDKLPERPGAAAFKGTLLHSVLEDMFDLPPHERTVDTVSGMLPTALEKYLETEPDLAFAIDESLEWPGEPGTPSDESIQLLLSSARTLTKKYFDLESPQALNPSEREHHVEVELGDIRIHGIIDRIERTADGAIRISDYKTGKSPRPAWAAKYWFQMKFYALLLYKTEGVLAKELRLLFLGDGQILRHSPTVEEIDLFEKEVLELAAQIRAAVQAGRFTPKPTKLCDWCSFQALCPAQGGIELPLPYTPIA